MPLLRLWFGLSRRVDDGTYLVHGALLMLIKYAVDALAVWLVTRRFWTPFDYLKPFNVQEQTLGPVPQSLLLAMALWALPFLWIGVSMSLRRLADAGLSPWWCLLFFMPFVNWLLIIGLAAAPSAPREARVEDHAEADDRVQAVLIGIAGSLVIGAISFGLQVLLLKQYSSAVFLGTPFTMGAVAGYFYNRRRSRGARASAGVGALSLALASTLLLLVAFEGVLCLAMALPLVMGLGALGGLVGRAIAMERRASLGAAALAVLLLPAAGWAEMRLSPAPLREVLTSIEIEAPPEKVWPNVIGFSDLPAPPEWFFRLGIAYPQRARINRSGVGALRRCEFSTGAFVEPITAWEEPARLAFDVASQPAPMEEWSPYRRLHPPHLDGTMVSRRGEFRLVRLPGGRTRLEGRTWYQLMLSPNGYWAVWADLLVHRIHRRVLEHIQRLAERPA